MRIGILGGTFDPVHNGHLAIARAARDSLSLDLVLFIPAGDPWRKTRDLAREITPTEHRLAMLQLAIAGDKTFGISDIELRHEGPSYTADTLEALAAERLDDEFWFIVGADALADMPHWKDPERIVRHARIAATTRRGADIEAAIAALPALMHRIERFDMPPWNESATEIRRRSAAGIPIDDLVPAAVANYIAANKLYSSPDD